MRNNLFARRAFTVGIIAALFAAFLIGPAPVAAAGTGTIVFDYSHGQYSSNLWNTTDAEVESDLEAMGYTVVFAYGGINASILENAVGFVAGSMYGSGNGFAAAEFTAITNWFNAGHKFMWIGYDSDYAGNQYINDNMTKILEDTGSHVFGEPLSVEDPISNCGSGYRPVANVTSDNAFVAPIVAGVEKVLMHGPTCLYGSSTATEGAGVVALETGTIPNVYPFLYYGASATIVNADLINGYAHDEGDTGSFVAATIEIGTGTAGTGVIIVSGASPYGDYRPMAEAEYYDVVLTGGLSLVVNGIDFGMNQAQATDMTLILAIGAIGAVIVIVIIIAVMKRK